MHPWHTHSIPDGVSASRALAGWKDGESLRPRLHATPRHATPCHASHWSFFGLISPSVSIWQRCKIKYRGAGGAFDRKHGGCWFLTKRAIICLLEHEWTERKYPTSRNRRFNGTLRCCWPKRAKKKKAVQAEQVEFCHWLALDDSKQPKHAARPKQTGGEK